MMKILSCDQLLYINTTTTTYINTRISISICSHRDASNIKGFLNNK